jgi:hypothetical protein
MRRWKLGFAATLACLTVWGCATLARAMLIAPQPGPNRVLNSDVVIVGKVTALEPEDKMVDNVTYRIAVLQVDKALRGAKDDKTVRVGFIPLQQGKVGPIFKNRNLQLQVGMEGLFLLAKHPKEKFYTVGGPIGYYISSQNNANFEKDVQMIKTITKVMDDPQTALKSKEADERLLAVSVLVEKYRTFKGPGQPKQEAIDAAESKQILQALADADWQVPVALGSLRPSPGQIFGRLGINQKDGFMVPPGANYQTAAQAWLRDNAEKYRIQRFVAGDAK